MNLGNRSFHLLSRQQDQKHPGLEGRFHLDGAQNALPNQGAFGPVASTEDESSGYQDSSSAYISES
jgi:hypothetical protein